MNVGDGNGTNYRMVTIQDCIENKKYKNKAVVLSDGEVIGFVKEKDND